MGEGSTSAMKARIALAMAETNQGYENAGIATRLRLVHTQQVLFAESGNIFADVARLRGTTDGYIDYIHTIRSQFGADMVALIVEDGGGCCGVASAIMAEAETAFQVTRRSGCMTGYYSFGHEFGHLQGARHDTYVDPSTTPFTWGHGFVHPHWSDPAERWRTVMAYNSRCADSGYNCTRLLYWSNHLNYFQGDKMGNPTSRNFRVIDATAAIVAGFQKKKIADDFGSGFNRNMRYWTPVVGTWEIVNDRYLKSKGVPGHFASIKRLGNYGDVTFEAKLRRVGCETCSNGLILRGKPSDLSDYSTWTPSYLFLYSNSGAYSIWTIDADGNETALRDWTSHPAIKPERWNKLKVVFSDISFRLYINGTLIWTGDDFTSSPLRSGKLGISFYRDLDSTGNRFWVDWARASTTPTADLPPDARVVPGGEVMPGGTVDQAP